MLVTCDVDGVICNGAYTPRDIRTPGYYLGLEPVPDAAKWLTKLTQAGVDIEYITSRSYRGAYDSTIQWMRARGIPTGKALHVGVAAWEKPQLSQKLYAEFHIDDNPLTNLILYKYVSSVSPMMFLDKSYNDGKNPWADPYGIEDKMRKIGMVFGNWETMGKFLLEGVY